MKQPTDKVSIKSAVVKREVFWRCSRLRRGGGAKAPRQTQEMLERSDDWAVLCVYFSDFILGSKRTRQTNKNTKNVYWKIWKTKKFQGKWMVNKLLSNNADCTWKSSKLHKVLIKYLLENMQINCNFEQMIIIKCFFLDINYITNDALRWNMFCYHHHY